jgi:hypothetical protein
MPKAKMSTEKVGDGTGTQSPTPLAVPREKALVFISHDSREADLAEAFGNLLTDASGWLMFINSLRDDLPWVYDLGMELYRALCAQDARAIEAARRSLMAALEMGQHSRSMRHLGGDDDPESFMVLRHLSRMIEHYLERLAPEQPTKRRLKGKDEPESSP